MANSGVTIIGQIIKKQRNFCVNLLRKTKAEYFQNLNIRDFSDNRKLWKTIKSYFTNKELNSNKLLLKEKGNPVSNEKQLATIMNSFLIDVTKDLERKEDNESNVNTLEDMLDAFNSDPSIERIKPLNLMKSFHFNQYLKIRYVKLF